MRTFLLVLTGLLWLATTDFADTVKLGDGTVLTGSITREDATTITMDVELAGGTIRSTRTVPKTEIAEIQRLSDAEKKQLQMEKDFQAAMKYRLDPVKSLAGSQYDQIISNTFSRFLTDYPGSAHGDEITARLREWQVERDRVAGGEAKYAGQWRPAAEVAALVEKDNGQQWLQSAQLLISQNKPEQAMAYLRGVAGLKTQPELAAEARALMTKTYEESLGVADGQVNQLQQLIETARREFEQAQQVVAKAETVAQQPPTAKSSKLKSGKQKGGYQALGAGTEALSGALVQSSKARADLVNAQNKLVLLEGQLAVAQQKADQLRASARQAGVQLAAVPGAGGAGGVSSTQTTTVVSVETATPAESRDLMTQLADMLQWIKNHWLLFLIGAVVVLWLVSHLMR